VAWKRQRERRQAARYFARQNRAHAMAKKDKLTGGRLRDRLGDRLYKSRNGRHRWFREARRPTRKLNRAKLDAATQFIRPLSKDSRTQSRRREANQSDTGERINGKFYKPFAVTVYGIWNYL
jgi:hypothetical protein